jgi:hypothetical protein
LCSFASVAVDSPSSFASFAVDFEALGAIVFVLLEPDVDMLFDIWANAGVAIRAAAAIDARNAFIASS